MCAMPGNRNYEQRVEFGTLCRHYLPRCPSIALQCVFQLAMMLANISNIVQTAQVVDYIIDQLFTDSCAIELYPRALHCFCSTNRDDISPFGTGKTVLSL